MGEEMDNHHVTFTSNCENKNNSRNVKTKGLASSASKLAQMYNLFFKLHKETPIIAFSKPSFLFKSTFFEVSFICQKMHPTGAPDEFFDIYVPV